MPVLNNNNIKIHDYFNAGHVFGMKLNEANLTKTDLQEEIEERFEAISKLSGSYRRSLKRFFGIKKNA